jgi:hypothetical protein
MPEPGEIWRYRKEPSSEARVLAVLNDPAGEADTSVATVYPISGGSRVGVVPLQEFLRLRELKPSFEEGDVIEYPSGQRYYVGQGGGLYRIVSDPTAIAADVTAHAKKIN